MSTKLVRFGLIGYGLFGSHHANAIRNCAESELAAIAEAFRAWAADPYSVFVVPNGEVLASA